MKAIPLCFLLRAASFFLSLFLRALWPVSLSNSERRAGGREGETDRRYDVRTLRPFSSPLPIAQPISVSHTANNGTCVQTTLAIPSEHPPKIRTEKGCTGTISREKVDLSLGRNEASFQRCISTFFPSEHQSNMCSTFLVAPPGPVVHAKVSNEPEPHCEGEQHSQVEREPVLVVGVEVEHVPSV